MSIEMLEAGPKGAKVLSVFDFDGTLTRHDSFVPFLRFAFGTREFTNAFSVGAAHPEVSLQGHVGMSLRPS